MKIELAFQERDHYLYVHMLGAFEHAAVREALVAIKAKAQQSGYSRILLEGMQIIPPKNNLERYLIGESVAEVLGPHYRMAAVFHAEFINKVGENTAVNRGADLYLCGSEDEALRWLLRGLPGGGAL